MIGRAEASKTDREALDGPGPIINLEGMLRGVDKDGAGGISDVIIRLLRLNCLKIK